MKHESLIQAIIEQTDGLLTECLWFFQAIFPMWISLLPYFFMCSIPAAPNHWAAIGAGSIPTFSAKAPTWRSIGLTRSSYPCLNRTVILRNDYQKNLSMSVLCQSRNPFSSFQIQQPRHIQQYHQLPTVEQASRQRNQLSNCCLHCKWVFQSFLMGRGPFDHSKILL